ncbi:TetR/AcrR family transcriptional regulator [Streptomyces sp. P9-2B-2]|uniref:TetR/AcrR family transcriptional regulator n=1 Tax=Streptomyces TaxID=1883 RepID=UPI00224F4010|nr:MULTISPECIES: TetR/AcrR family transcriptional regulator [Streptomyces]MCX4639703.1 TetR family transcriptional regulator C-terminal domain-containing protein [Streptomyces platensis]WJY39771.1 TetR/AcrR family transcriptional regulator [Streptomyces sp. P9-2B-2]
MNKSRQEEILAAALRLTYEQGVGALSVRSVAAAAGVGATTLRHYFPSQADLYQAVASRLVTSVLSDLDITDDSRDPAARLYDCLAQFVPQPTEQTQALTGWAELHRLALGGDAGVMEILKSGRQASKEALLRWFGALADQGHTARADINTHATHALTLIDGLNLDLFLFPDQVDLAAAKTALRWFAERTVS